MKYTITYYVFDRNILIQYGLYLINSRGTKPDAK